MPIYDSYRFVALILIFRFFSNFYLLFQIDHEGHFDRKEYDRRFKSVLEKDREEVANIKNELEKKLSEATDLCSAGQMFYQNLEFFNVIFERMDKVNQN